MNVWSWFFCDNGFSEPEAKGQTRRFEGRCGKITGYLILSSLCHDQ